MAKALTLTLSPDQVTALMAAMPAAARLPGSGIGYADGVLTVPSEFSAAAAAAMKKPGWDAPPDPKAVLRSYASEKRRQIETAGIKVGDIAIATDDQSQGKIVAAYLAASRDADWHTLWNSVHPVDAKAMLAIGDAVQAHINATFRTRAAVWAAIASGEITTTADVDAAFG